MKFYQNVLVEQPILDQTKSALSSILVERNTRKRRRRKSQVMLQMFQKASQYLYIAKMARMMYERELTIILIEPLSHLQIMNNMIKLWISAKIYQKEVINEIWNSSCKMKISTSLKKQMVHMLQLKHRKKRKQIRLTSVQEDLDHVHSLLSSMKMLNTMVESDKLL